MSDTVTIGARTFRVGATYAPKRAKSRTGNRTFSGKHIWRGWVVYRDDDGGFVSITANGWARWAGEEIAP